MRRPAPPFTTSTLQQECARRMRFSVKRTMAVAQQLYEGIEAEGETRGLITYMRTDSVRVAADAIAEVREQIDALYGRDYVPETPNHYRTKNSAQDAHEAIRPTSVALHPDKVKHLLTPDQARVYSLIWKRFVTSQMKPQILNITTANVEAGPYLLRAAGSVVKFPGFTLLYSESKEEEDKSEAASNGMAEGEDASRTMPADIAEGEVLKSEQIAPEQHFTKPPPRFTEASLVKQLESEGIGRPSTYAQIITTILDRKYVEKVDNRYFVATERGQTVNKLLVDTFPHLFNVAFTANMEDKLDQVEDGGTNWVEIVQQFYDSWKGDLDSANNRRKELKRALQEVSDEDCEDCRGRHGRQVGAQRSLPRVLWLPPSAKTPNPSKSKERRRPTRSAINAVRLCLSRWGAMAASWLVAAIQIAKTSSPISLESSAQRTVAKGRLWRRGRAKARSSLVAAPIPSANSPSWGPPHRPQVRALRRRLALRKGSPLGCPYHVLAGSAAPSTKAKRAKKTKAPKLPE